MSLTLNKVAKNGRGSKSARIEEIVGLSALSLVGFNVQNIYNKKSREKVLRRLKNSRKMSQF